MLTRLLIAALLWISLLTAPARAADPITFTVHADKVTGQIDLLIYGHFFEHIYNGGDNGVWGEMVWNRSFEYVTDTAGKWAIKDGILSQSAIVDGARLLFGDPKWSDYEFTCEGRKVSGNEGFLVLVRAVDDSQLFWANIAGWTNTGHRLQHLGAPRNVDLGQLTRGNINSDQWYKLRIRCEGPHIQAWLDDAKVIDINLPGDLNHGGMVGLGAWQTSVEYRNIKVAALDGKVLLEGLPELPKPKSPAGIHWKSLGGDVHLVNTGAFNDETAVQMEMVEGSASLDVGVSQDHFSLKKGESYKGSLYVKGVAPAGGHLRFKSNGSNGKTIVDVPIAAPVKDWEERTIQFTASEDEPDATLEISFAGSPDRPRTNVSLDQVSLMAQSSINNAGFRADTLKAFADLKPTIIRWPGGCYAEQYHWKNGVGPQTARKKNLIPMWDDYDPNALGTDEYMVLCQKVGAQPLLVINTGMHVSGTKNAAEWEPWIKEAAEWVEYCNGSIDTPMGKMRAANGHAAPYHVKFWEIDNELWRSLQTNPAVYAQAVPLFALAMKKVDPSITIIAHGGNGTDRNYDRTLLNNAAESFDILSIHHYTDAAKFDTGVADQDALYKDLTTMIAVSKNPKIRLDVSEWNAQTIDWRTGLYAGGILNTFEEDNIMIGGPALLFRYTGARDWDNSFINFNQNDYFVAPNYVVMKLWRDNFAAERIETTPLPAGSKLNVIATRKDAGKTIVLKLVNPSNAPMDLAVTVDDGKFNNATFDLVAPEGGLSARNSMDKKDVVAVRKAEVKVDGTVVRFTMPAYSAGVVTTN